MKRLVCVLFLICCAAAPANAFWVWTPESGKWVNPKYSVKETPQQQLEFGLECAKAEDYAKAIQEMEKLIKYYPKAREAADARFYIGEFQEKTGELGKAFKSYQDVIKKYPFSDRAPEIVKRQYEIGTKALDNKAKREKEGLLNKIGASKVDAVEVFETVIKNQPYGEYAAPSQYKIGLFLKEEGLLQEARDAFEKTVNDYPMSEWAKAARYQIALADSERSAAAGYDQKITESAIEEFKGLIEEYPDAELSQDAKKHIQTLRDKEAENSFIIAEFYEKQKKYDSAKIYYSAIIENYKNTVWAQKALEKLQRLEVQK
ncbi:MAG TPA: outer membrane protein assembly factor BamD [Candidatus Omnitrophota bacterium]|jgi:outer membrane assembly lipoprotein YfiO|nr:outer membrane protein assembly factor BamD [Candidatus Omnitrophota bacterium]